MKLAFIILSPILYFYVGILFFRSKGFGSDALSLFLLKKTGYSETLISMVISSIGTLKGRFVVVMAWPLALFVAIVQIGSTIMEIVWQKLKIARFCKGAWKTLAINPLDWATAPNETKK